MFNPTLYLQGIKGIWKMLLIFAAILTMYFTIIISMFDPALGSALNEFAEAMPELMATVGMDPSSTTMISFMSAYLYGFIMLIFPMIFSIICANSLVARHVEKGSMTYLLAAPVKRRSVAFTQSMVLCTGIVFLSAFATVLGIVACEVSFPDELDIKGFVLLNVGALCLQLFIGAICFLASCVFSDTKLSIAFGAGIPALGFIIQMLANAGDELEGIKYATFFTLYNPEAVAAGETEALLGIAVLFVGALVLFFVAIAVFARKDLHI